MVKKNTADPEPVLEAPPEEEAPFDTGEEETEIDTDFDLEDEFKPEPLVPNGNYRGNVVGVAHDRVQNCIAWKVTLAENGGVMSDGETPIDGWSGYCRNWLPKPGDDNEMTKDGRQTKRQSKINMMKRFAEGMKINMNTPKIIAETIANQDWVGIPVIASLTMDEYLGVTRNQISKIVAAESQD